MCKNKTNMIIGLKKYNMDDKFNIDSKFSIGSLSWTGQLNK